MSDVQAELLTTTKLTPKPGESAEDFTVRVAEKVHSKFSNDQWEALSEEVQQWVNDNIVAIEEKKPVGLLTLPEVEASGEEGEKEQAMASAKKKAPAKKAAAAEQAVNGGGARGR